MVLVIVFFWSAVAGAVGIAAVAVGLLQTLQLQQLVCQVVSEGLSKKNKTAVKNTSRRRQEIRFISSGMNQKRVLWIRIRKFLGLPVPSIIKQKSLKNRVFYCFFQNVKDPQHCQKHNELH